MRISDYLPRLVLISSVALFAVTPIAAQTITGTFTASATSVAEGSGRIDLTVTFPVPTWSAAVVPLTYSGTAVRDVDYTGSAMVFDGTNRGYASINVIPDDIAEPSETIDVALGQLPFPGFEVAPQQITITIINGRPVITNIFPMSGTESGGTEVTIRGANLVNVTGVTFGGVAATNVTCATVTQCVATTPAGFGRADVRITNSAGTSADSEADDFSYVTRSGSCCLKFAVQPAVSAASTIYDLVVADFNADGRADLGVAMGSAGIQILLGNGNGTFSPSDSYSESGKWFDELAVGDFDGDGHIDLAGSAWSEVAILFTGAGAAQAVTYTCSNGIVGAADFNADGRTDLLISGGAGESVMLAVGGRAFVTSSVVTSGSVSGVGVGDFNNDGNVDLAIPRPDTDKKVHLFSGTGIATFTESTSGPLVLGGGAYAPLDVVVADWNGDGVADLITRVSDPSAERSHPLYWSPSDGSGGFTEGGPPRCYGGCVNAPTDFSRPGDLNGDGHPEVVVTWVKTDELGQIITTGGGLAVKGLFPEYTFDCLQPRAAGIGDFNSDGRNDIVFAPDGGNSIQLLLNSAHTGTFALSSATYSASEGGSVAVTVRRADGFDCSATVDYATSSGTASSVDFTDTHGQLTFAEGETAKTVTIPIANDAIYEGNETFTFTLSNPVGAALGAQTSATVTIVDDETVPTVSLSVDRISINEADAGTPSGTATVMATLWTVSAFDTVLKFQFGGSATAGVDYATLPQEVTIPAGSSSMTLALTVINDANDEPEELILLTLLSATHATFTAPQVGAAIVDNDAPPSITMELTGSPMAEAGGVAQLTIAPTPLSGYSIAINLTFDGTATRGIDYSDVPATVTIEPLSTLVIPIHALPDTLFESNETFVIAIANATNATLPTPAPQVTGVITEERPAPAVELSSSGSMSEAGGSVTITATLSTASAVTATVNLLFGGTAVAGTDYTVLTAAISIPAGQTSGSIVLTPQQDTIYDPEVIVINAGTLVNCSGPVAPIQISIADDDPPPQVTFGISANTIAENGGSATITATLSAASEVTTVAHLAFSGTATNGTDFSTTQSDGTPSTVISIPPGVLTGSVILRAIDDAIDEADETAIVSISSIDGGTAAGTQQFTITIIDDDSSPAASLGVDTNRIVEGGGVATVTATLAAVSQQPLTVGLSYSGTATHSADYDAPLSIIVPAGQLTASIPITAKPDSIVDPDEKIVVSAGTQQFTITIDDGVPAISFMAPAFGPQSGGTVVSIHGSNFVAGATSVKFGSADATSVNCSPTLCTATAPTGSGSVRVRLTTAAGTSADIPAAKFVYTAPPATACVVFETSTVNVGMLRPQGLVVADLNGDGFADFVEADEASPQISIVLGTGGGSFTPPAIHSVGTDPYSIVAADFTDDGFVDLAVFDLVSFDWSGGSPVFTSAVWLMTGNGTGAFAGPQKILSIPDAMNIPIAADFNGDGRVDIAGYGTDFHFTLLSTGKGTFIERRIASTPDISHGYPAAGEFTGDGKADLAVIDYPYNIRILVGDGTGGFSEGQTLTTTFQLTGVVAADFNDDGLADLAAIAPYGGVVPFLANGAGTFTQGAIITSSDDSIPLAADLNGDGHIDLAAVNLASRTLVVRLGDGAAAFSPPTYQPLTGISFEVFASDFDNDGRIDILTTDADADGIGIFRNVTAPGTLAFSSATYAAGETAGSITVTVNRTGGSHCAASLDYATADGTAREGLDYSPRSGTIAFAPGETSKSIVIPITNDTVDEADETFAIALSNVVGATLGAPSAATITISDESLTPAVALSISGSTMNEAGGIATVTATLSAPSVSTVTVTLGFSGTATAADYTTSAASILIPAGSLTGSMTLAAVQDSIDEVDETIVVQISSLTNAMQATPQQVTATIVDDDPAPSIAIADAMVNEGNTGTTDIAFPVTLSAQSSHTITVSYATVPGSALAPEDFASASGVLTFAPGVTSQTIVVKVVADAIWENDETFTVALSNAANAAIATPTATGTIINDDSLTGYPWIRSIMPAAGRAGGGTSVTISGSGFTAGAIVTFAGVAATNVNVLSTSQITATTPSHPVGNADLIVRNPNGETGILPRAYTFAPAGDANGDGQISAADIFFLIQWLFANGPAPTDCADVHGDGGVDATEIFYLINYLFGGGPPPR